MNRSKYLQMNTRAYSSCVRSEMPARQEQHSSGPHAAPTLTLSTSVSSLLPWLQAFLLRSLQRELTSTRLRVLYLEQKHHYGQKVHHVSCQPKQVHGC